MTIRRLLPLALALPLAGLAVAAALAAAQSPAAAHVALAFLNSRECFACHNGLTTPSGEDVSIGSSWRGSMMANAARDPYWMAGVRREIIDHPTAQAEIEDECSICHMPMARALAHEAGRKGEIFAHLPIGTSAAAIDDLAADGVGCALCHQISDQGLGTRESFVGGFVLKAGLAPGQPVVLGPYEVDAGRQRLMRSATGFTPAAATHLRQSEMCATCHTLITASLGPNGEHVGELPEQVMYLEWRHSAFASERSCQSCHMPPVTGPTPISSVVGQPRDNLARHTFLGGNVFMLRLLNRYRDELGVEALPSELEASARGTVHQLQNDTARIAIDRAEVSGGRLAVDVAVTNLTGHKLPTGYPSRRAWINLVVRDRAGRVVFESGALEPTGQIRGNDNDADARRFEPHYERIDSPDAVQIYETIMADPAGAVTTGLLRAVRYVKDNRLLPRGFDKATAPAEVAVHGAALTDVTFTAGSDRVRYAVGLAAADGPFTVEATLRFQTIAFRWADNLRGYDAFEPRRFVGYYDEMSAATATDLARATATAGH
jgi:hypothetical protein